MVINSDYLLETTLRDSDLSGEKEREVEIGVEVKRLASDKPLMVHPGTGRQSICQLVDVIIGSCGCSFITVYFLCESKKESCHWGRSLVVGREKRRYEISFR